MQGSILPFTIPPGHTPGDLQFFFLLGGLFPTPGTPHRPQIRCFVFKIDFRTIAQQELKRFLEFTERRILHSIKKTWTLH